MSIYKVSGSDVNLNDIASIPPYDPFVASDLVEIQALFHTSQSGDDVSLEYYENKQFRSIEFTIVGATGSLNIVGPITGSYNTAGNRITSGITGSGTPLYCVAIDYTSSANVIVQANTLNKGEFVGFYDYTSDELLVGGVLGQVITNQSLTNTDWVDNNRVVAKFSPFRTVSPTPSITVTATPTKTPSISISSTPTSTATPTRTVTSATPTRTASITGTPGSTVSNTPTRTKSISISATSTPTPTVTPSNTPTRTPSISISGTPTPTVTVTPSPTDPLDGSNYCLSTTPYGACYCTGDAETISIFDADQPIEVGELLYKNSTGTKWTFSELQTLLSTSNTTLSISRITGTGNTNYITIQAQGSDAKATAQGTCVSTTPSATPSTSISSTATPTPTRTRTISDSATPSNTPTNSVTPSITPSISISNTPTPTRTRTRTISDSPTISVTSTVTATATRTRTISDTPTNSPTPTRTASNTPTASVTATPTRTASNTRTASVTPTISDTPTNSPTPTRTRTISDTPTNSPTPTRTRTISDTPTNTPTRTRTRTISDTPTRTKSISFSSTPTPTRTRTRTISDTPTASVTATQTPTRTKTRTISDTPTRTITPTPSNSPIASNCSSSTYDIEFLFDESGSITGGEYQEMKDAAVAIVEKFTAYLSSGGTGFQFGGSSFASGYSNEFNLSAVFSTISSSLHNMTQSGGTTQLSAGLTGSYATVTGSSGARSVDKKILVFTDGSPNSQVASAAAADYVNNDSYDGTHRTEIIAVGVGVSGATAAFLSGSIAATTSSYLNSDDFASLTGLANAVANLICAPLPSPTPTPTKTVTRTATKTPSITPSRSNPNVSMAMGALSQIGGANKGFSSCSSACNDTKTLFTAYATKGTGNTNSSVVEVGDFLYNDSAKTSPLDNGKFYWQFITVGVANCIEIGASGEVEAVTSCSSFVSPTPTRTRTRTVTSATPTRTRTKSTSSSGTCQSLNLAFDSSSSDDACDKYPATNLFYGDGAFQSGTRLYTNSTCTNNSATGWYSNGMVAFQKTSTGGGLTNGIICAF